MIERYPVLSQALLAGASGQLRNLATVGGNLLQRTRCSYFQDVTKPCNKRRPGSGCPAREGDHRNLAILGHSEHCVATHPSDMAVALAAIGASVHVLGANGERTIPLPGLHRLPGDKPQHDTVLDPGDLITAVELGAPAPRSAYRKVRDRASFAFAVFSVAAIADVDDDGTIREAPHRPRRGRARAVAGRARRGRTARRARHRRELRRGRRRRARPRAAAARQRVQGAARPQRPRPHARGAVRVTVVAGRAIGAALSRVEGREKVTGEARYAFEQPIEGVAYAAAVTATIAAGEIDAIDPARALALPGVLAVISHDNAPQLGETADGELLLFQSDTVHYRGQIVAAVVAETLEAAREGADAVHIDYAPREHDVELRLGHPGFYKPDKVNPSFPTDTAQGDAEAALERAEVVVDETYATPADPQQPDGAARQPRAVGGRQPHGLRLDPGHAGAPAGRSPRSSASRPEQVRVVSQHVGGGFGSKGTPRPQSVLAAIAAKVVERPVKVALTRQQMFATRRLPHADDPARAARRDPRRAPDRDRPRRLRADLDGARVRRADHHADAHDVRRARPPDDAPARRRSTSRPRRGCARPASAPACTRSSRRSTSWRSRCGIDPIELRIRNEPDLDPEKGIPFSSRNLVACLREGAERFGWADRDPTPGAREDGRWLIGTGVAASTYPVYRAPVHAPPPASRPTAASPSRSPPPTSAPARAPC